MNIAGDPADESVDSMSVGKLFPFRHVVGVADLVGYLYTLAADFTPPLDSGHPSLLPMSGIAALRTGQILLNAP